MTPPDTLIDSYRSAQKLLDEAGPSELTRQRILAHAEQLANNKPSQDGIISSENATDLIASKAINTPAANDSQWKIRALASIAVFGIAGLLMLQLRKEAPEAFVPTAKPPVAAERVAESVAISERESKSAADKAVQAPVQAAPAPAPAPATTPTIIKPTLKPDSQLAQNAQKSDARHRNDLEAATPKSEALAERAADVAPPLTASAPAAKVASAPAAAPAVTTMADSAKLSRSAPMASRATAKETTNADNRLFTAIHTKNAAALKLALEGGDDKNAKNADGTPALSVCVQNEQLNLVQLLIAAGADVNALDARGLSPLAHARNRGFTDIVNILLNSGAK
jgi:cytoskeletal protein RodZ